MKPTRPDLDSLEPHVRAYIEALEVELDRLRTTTHLSSTKRREVSEKLERVTEPTVPPEPPTTINVITVTASGLAKRTPRHLYSRQRRGGMGVFDIESPGSDPPRLITIVDQNKNLLLITNMARAFRLSVSTILETSVRSRGSELLGKYDLLPGEHIAAVVPDQPQGYVALLSEHGMVRRLRHHVFGEYMMPGTSLYDYKSLGAVVAVCRTHGDGDIFIATRHGKAIRFAERLIAPQGTQAIRLASGDIPVAITPVYPGSGVFLLGADGKGTVRLMSGFAANKSPGGGGKIAMSTDHLLCALNTDDSEDVFIITGLSKIIRFQLVEIPPKESIVQGVLCMSLRADEPIAAVLSA